jgi:hypothetical protein
MARGQDAAGRESADGRGKEALIAAEADLTARGVSENPMEILARSTFSGPQDPDIEQAIQRDYEKIQAGF